MALSPVVGQNFGAQQYDRIRLALRRCRHPELRVRHSRRSHTCLSASALAGLFNLSATRLRSSISTVASWRSPMAFTACIWPQRKHSPTSATQHGAPLPILCAICYSWCHWCFGWGSTANGCPYRSIRRDDLKRYFGHGCRMGSRRQIGCSAASSQAPTRRQASSTAPLHRIASCVDTEWPTMPTSRSV